MSREDAIKFASMLEEAVNAHDTALIMSLYKEDALMVSPMFRGSRAVLQSPRFGKGPSHFFRIGRCKCPM